MFGRHEFCQQTSSGGTVCECDCGEKHGTKYVKPDIDTPIHLLFRKVADAYKRGEVFSESEGFKDETTAIELSYKREPDPVVTVDYDAVTLEELEKKRD